MVGCRRRADPCQAAIALALAPKSNAASWRSTRPSPTYAPGWPGRCRRTCATRTTRAPPSSATPATTILGADEIGPGLFVLSGNSNIFSDSSDSGYVTEDNGVLVANLCGGESGGLAITALSPAHLWFGLRNSDDQGTQFDVKVELYDGSTLIASGLQRCISGVTRNPSKAKEAIVTWDAFAPFTVNHGDTLSFKVSTRIGTTPTDAKCLGPGGSHNNAVGPAPLLRLDRPGLALRHDPRWSAQHERVPPLRRLRLHKHRKARPFRTGGSTRTRRPRRATPG